MQAVVDKIFENKSFMFIVWVIGVLAAVALGLFIFRLAFGRRLRSPGGGRTRLPRLGVVDAFDLDRYRQLVIVRRDNVEHLLMIGGPNDLVIESEIIRAELRDARMRDKDAREKEPKDLAPIPVHVAPIAAMASSAGALPWQAEFDPARAVAPESGKSAMAPVPLDASAPAAPEADGPVVPAEQAAPPPRAPAFPAVRRAAEAFMPPRPPRPPREPLARPDLATRVEPGAGASRSPQRAPLATPFIRPSPPRQLADPKVSNAAAAAASAASTFTARREEPPAAPAGPASAFGHNEELTDAAAEPAPPEGSAAAAAAPQADRHPAQDAPPDAGKGADEEANLSLEVDGLEHSLEEEMARLLGRGP